MKNRAQKKESLYPNFVSAYIANHRNGTKAYKVIKPRSTESTAATEASKLLRNPKIQALLAEAEEKLQDKFDVTASRVIQEMSRLAFVDVRKLYNEDGSMKSPHELDDDTAAALAAIDTEELFEGQGNNREHIGSLKKVRLFSKPETLRDLAKYLGLFAKDNKQRTDPIAELLSAVSNRGKPLPIRK